MTIGSYFKSKRVLSGSMS